MPASGQEKNQKAQNERIKIPRFGRSGRAALGKPVLLLVSVRDNPYTTGENFQNSLAVALKSPQEGGSGATSVGILIVDLLQAHNMGAYAEYSHLSVEERETAALELGDNWWMANKSAIAGLLGVTAIEGGTPDEQIAYLNAIGKDKPVPVQIFRWKDWVCEAESDLASVVAIVEKDPKVMGPLTGTARSLVAKKAKKGNEDWTLIESCGPKPFSDFLVHEMVGIFSLLTRRGYEAVAYPTGLLKSVADNIYNLLFPMARYGLDDRWVKISFGQSEEGAKQDKQKRREGKVGFTEQLGQSPLHRGFLPPDTSSLDSGVDGVGQYPPLSFSPEGLPRGSSSQISSRSNTPRSASEPSSSPPGAALLAFRERFQRPPLRLPRATATPQGDPQRDMVVPTLDAMMVQQLAVLNYIKHEISSLKAEVHGLRSEKVQEENQKSIEEARKWMPSGLKSRRSNSFPPPSRYPDQSTIFSSLTKGESEVQSPSSLPSGSSFKS